MPLRAVIENKEVISSFLTKNEWEELKNRVKENNIKVIIAQTSKNGYLRISKKGLQHFVHKNGEKPDGWKPESPQHLLAKNEILLGCQDAGWNAVPEYAENEWIADIIASKGSHRIALEVQWSNQTYERTIERQEKYNQDKVRACWFFKKLPKELSKWSNSLSADKSLPLFKIDEEENGEFLVEFYNQKIALRKFTFSLLSGEIKYCNNVKAKLKQKITANFFKTNCWKCKAEQNAYFISGDFDSECGINVSIENRMWDNNNLEYDSQVLEAVSNFLKTEKGTHIKLGKIKSRYSHTTKSSYMSFGCYKCDSIFGDFYLSKESFNARVYEEIDEELEIEYKAINIKEENPHWCFSKDKKHCE